MTLETGVKALAEAVAADVKEINLKSGDLSQLTTTANSNLVEAINEAAASGGGTIINDNAGVDDTDVTWSADKSSKELADKVDKEAGKQLSDENYTLDEKDKLSGIAEQATKNRSDSENADKVHTHTPAEVGLGEVDNTSDEDKPMSRAQRAAMAAKFNRGDVAQEVGDNSSKVMSQKASTEAFFRAGSGVTKAGKIHVQSTEPTVDVEDGDIWLKI